MTGPESILFAVAGLLALVVALAFLALSVRNGRHLRDQARAMGTTAESLASVAGTLERIRDREIQSDIVRREGWMR